MCDWTDRPGRYMSSSASSSRSLAMATPGYAHERDVDDEREPLTPLQLPHPNTDHNPRSPICAGSKTTSPTLEFSRDRFSTFVNDEDLAILSKGVVPVNTDRNAKWASSNFFCLERS